MKTFAELQFEVMSIYEFQIKADSVWSQFEVIYLYEFQTKENSYEGIC